VTLIICAAAPGALLQVSDRKTTHADSGAEHDAFANKSVVVAAEDGALIFGYCGMAYFGRLPTDQALAEAIVGRGLRGAIASWSAAEVRMDVWSIALRVLDAIRAQTPMSIRTRTSISIAGFVLRKRRARPFLWVIEPVRGSHQLTRHRLTSQATLPLMIAGSGEREAARHIHDQCQRNGRPTSLEDLETRTVAVLRHVAEQDTTVGTDCMAVHVGLDPRGAVKVRAEFVAGHPRSLGFQAPVRRHVTPAAFTPWLITPTSAFAPSVAIGQQHWEVGGVRYEVVAPPMPSIPSLNYLGSQPRAKAPGAPPRAG
jgi:hypothetical protein